jgi:AraC-like DNA-binding protein
MHVLPAERYLLRARDLVDARYAEPLDVADLARTAGLSRARFSREFKSAFGESPHAYLLTRRLERAAALLRSTDRPVLEICLAVGLRSVGSFTTSFTRAYGMTPTAYRASIRTLMAKGWAGNVLLTTVGARASYVELTARGIEFTEAPEERPYAIDCACRDPSGNQFRLTQMTEVAAA